MSEGNNRRQRDLAIGLLLGAIVTVALIYTGYYFTHKVQKDTRLAKVPALPVAVQTVPAAVKVLRATIGASGTIQPSMPVMMTAKVVSRVLKVPIDLGSVVKPGDLLVEMDQRLFKTNLEAARVNYDHARNQLRRMQALMRKNFASAVELEKARTEEAEARDTVVRAEINLANTRVLSPVPAVVLERVINPGEITKVDQDLIQLGVLDPVLMVAQVPEDKIGAVYLGMRGVVGTDAFPGVNFTGLITKIDSRVNDATRTFGAYAQLANHDLRLKKGVTGYARFESSRMALAIPGAAVMNSVGDRATVFVVGEDKKAHRREIRQGLTVGGLTEVLGGLNEGDQVVIAGQTDLHDDESVGVNQFAPWNKASMK